MGFCGAINCWSLCNILNLLIMIPFLNIVMSKEECDSYKHVSINVTAADAQVGIIFPFRSADAHTVCNPSIYSSSVLCFESIQHFISLINQDYGAINGIEVHDSYVPGIKIGIKAYDDCENDNVFITHISELAEKTKTKKQFDTCEHKPLFLGLGVALLSTSDRLHNSINNFQLPIFDFGVRMKSTLKKLPYMLSLNNENIYRLQVMADIVDQLGCKSVFIITEKAAWNVENGNRITEIFTERNVEVTDKFVLHHELSYKDNRQIIEKLAQQNNTFIIIVLTSNSQVLSSLLEAACNLDTLRKLTWILRDSSYITLFYRYPYLLEGSFIVTTETGFTSFKDYLLTVDALSLADINPWYRLHYMSTNMCKLSGTLNYPYSSFPLCELPAKLHKSLVTEGFGARTGAVFAYLMAKALKNAWQEICQGHRGMCPELHNLTTLEFLENYVKIIDITFTKEDRVPRELYGARIHFNLKNQELYVKYKTPVLNFQKTKSGMQLVEVFMHDGYTLIPSSPYLTFDSMRNIIKSGQRC